MKDRFQKTSENDSQSDLKWRVSAAWQPPWNHVAIRNLINPQFGPSRSAKEIHLDPNGDPEGQQKTHLGLRASQNNTQMT